MSAENDMIERAAEAIRSKVPLEYGMTKEEAKTYATAAIEAAFSADLTEVATRIMRDKRAKEYWISIFNYADMEELQVKALAGFLQRANAHHLAVMRGFPSS